MAGCFKRSPRGSPVGNGRTDMDVASLAELLHETAEHHGAYEKVAPPHDWWDWYAAYMEARQSGSTVEEASAAASRYMAEVKHVVVPTGWRRPPRPPHHRRWRTSGQPVARAACSISFTSRAA